MGHKGEAQSSDSMPRERGIFKRGDTFYFRMRIPKSIKVIAGHEFSGKNEFKTSLYTKDKSQAEYKATQQKAQLLNRFKEIERLHKSVSGSRDSSKVANFATSSNPSPELQVLSDSEVRNLWVGEYVKLEKKADPERHEWQSLSLVDKEAVYYQIAEDLSNYQQVPREGEPPSVNWQKRVDDLLKTQSIERCQLSIENYEVLCRRLQDVYVEVWKRNLDSINGGSAKTHNEDVYRALDQVRNSQVARNTEVSSDGMNVALRQLCDEFIEHKRQSGLKPSSIKDYVGHATMLCALLEDNFPLHEVNVEKVKELVSLIKKIPTYANKRYPDLSLKEAIIMEGKKSKPALIQTIRQNAAFNAFVTMLDYAVEREWIKKNPAKKKLLRKELGKATTPKKDKTFTDEQVARLVSSEKFTAERQSSLQAVNPKGGRYWSILLCLYHGLRINEACQLLAEDVREYKGVLYIRISESDDEGNIVKSLKTNVSDRLVPVHQTLIKLGFKDFAEKQCKAGHTFLFPELKANTLNNKGSSVSKWFGRLKKKVLGDCADDLEGKSVHAFRHRIAQKLRANKVDPELRYRLCGWESDISLNSGANYGIGEDIVIDLKPVVDEIRLEGVEAALGLKGG